MSLDHDSLLAAVEGYPTSLREGSDSLVLLYWWRREGGEPADFMAGVQALLAKRLVEVLPGPDMRLRLTDDGFRRLDALLPEESAAAEMPEGSEDENAWQGGAARAPRETPPGELVVTLLKMFAVLRTPAGHPVSAGSLSKIWAMERRRGGDLRVALDTLAATGDLSIQRGSRTTFALTESGAARLPGLAP